MDVSDWSYLTAVGIRGSGAMLRAVEGRPR